MTWPVHQLVAEGDIDALRSRLTADGYVLRELDGAGIRDAATLWQRAGEAFGFDSVKGWDSFADRMWTALFPDDDEGDKVALIWAHADDLVDGALDAFLEAFDVLVTVVRGAYAEEIDLTVCFLGDGPGFARLADLP
jgi:hypothetical protein